MAFCRENGTRKLSSATDSEEPKQKRRKVRGFPDLFFSSTETNSLKHSLLQTNLTSSVSYCLDDVFWTLDYHPHFLVDPHPILEIGGNLYDSPWSLPTNFVGQWLEENNVSVCSMCSPFTYPGDPGGRIQWEEFGESELNSPSLKKLIYETTEHPFTYDVDLLDILPYLPGKKIELNRGRYFTLVNDELGIKYTIDPFCVSKNMNTCDTDFFLEVSYDHGSDKGFLSVTISGGPVMKVCRGVKKGCRKKSTVKVNSVEHEKGLYRVHVTSKHQIMGVWTYRHDPDGRNQNSERNYFNL
jgi:hypothetical protein